MGELARGGEPILAERRHRTRDHLGKLLCHVARQRRDVRRRAPAGAVFASREGLLARNQLVQEAAE